jgi:MFS family permease
MSRPAGTPADRRWWALAAIALAQLTIVLEMNIVPIALPSVRAELGITAIDAHWMVTAYTLSFATLFLLAVQVARVVGRRRAFVVGMCGFAASSVVAGLAGSPEMLFAARAAQGAFGALMLAPANLSLVAGAASDGGFRAKAIAVFTAVAGGGGVLGVVLGGVLTEYLGWRWCLFVVVPFAAVAVAVAFQALDVDRDRPSGRGLDLAGTAVFGAGLLAAVVAIETAGGRGIADPVVLALLSAAVAAVAAALWTQRRVRRPVLPPAVLADRTRVGVYTAVIAANVGTFGGYLVLSTHLQETVGLGPALTGLAFAPLSVGVLLNTTLATRLLPRVGARPVLVAGVALTALGTGWIMLLGPEPDYVWRVLPAMVLLGLGVAWIMVPANATAAASAAGADPAVAGVATAGVNASTQLGGVLGAPLLTTVAAAGGTVAAGATGGVLLAAAAVAVLVLVDARAGRAPGPVPAAGRPVDRVAR